MNLKEKARKIKLLAFDVDGVMTDGSITYDENGIEYKTFNAKDGHGLAKMAKNGFSLPSMNNDICSFWK